MGKAAGVARRRKKNARPNFKHKSKLAKAKKKLLLRPKIQDPVIRDVYDERKSKSKNFDALGLSADPNKTLEIPKPFESMFGPKRTKQKVRKVKPQRTDVVEKLEEKSKKKNPLRFHFGPELCEFLVAMMEKYGDDYKAMERDSSNHYLLSAGLIRRKIKQFMANPINSAAYRRAQEMVEESLGETSKDHDETTVEPKKKIKKRN